MLPESTQGRKADHLRVCLHEEVQCTQISPGFDRYRFAHCALPELDLEAIDLGTTFLGKHLGAPLLISSMTGGTETAKQLNLRLAAAAARWGLALGLGSQRVAIERPDCLESFAVRRVAPEILLWANLGAVQLNCGYGVAQAAQVVEDIAADGLILHLNPLQEAVQTGGDTTFAGLLDKIADLCARLPVPVIVKEVGNGISAAIAQKLAAAGVAAIDVAGAGGTSWARVESARASDPQQRRLGQTFADWGLPTAECVRAVRSTLPQMPLIASGGLRNGLDLAKAIALGANLGGMAWPFLQAADESEAALDFLVQVTLAELRTAMFCAGHSSVAELGRSVLLTV